MHSPFLLLPAELLEKIALHLPSTIDVFNLASANHFLQSHLIKSVLFKSRVAEDGWDLGHWEDVDNVDALVDSLSSHGRNLMHWKYVDHMHKQAQRLLDQSVSYEQDSSEYPQLCWWSTWDTFLFDAGDTEPPSTAQWAQGNVIDGRKACIWLYGMGPPLTQIVTHHSMN